MPVAAAMGIIITIMGITAIKDNKSISINRHRSSWKNERKFL